MTARDLKNSQHGKSKASNLNQNMKRLLIALDYISNNGRLPEQLLSKVGQTIEIEPKPKYQTVKMFEGITLYTKVDTKIARLKYAKYRRKYYGRCTIYRRRNT